MCAAQSSERNRGLYAASWIRRPSDQDRLRTRTGERDARLHEGGFDAFERRGPHVELAAGGCHELAAEYFDPRIHAVELSFERFSDQRAELRVKRQILANAFDHLPYFFTVDG